MSVEQTKPISALELEIATEIERSRQLLKHKEKRCEVYANMALHKAIAAGFNRYVVEAYLQLSDVYIGLHFDNLKALEFAKLALDNLQPDADIFFKARTLSQVAVCYYNLRDYAKAYTFYNETLRLVEDAEDTDHILELKCNLYDNLGAIYYLLGLYTLGKEHIEKSVVYAERLNNERLIYRSWFRVGNYYLYENLINEALKYYEKLFDKIDFLPSEEMKSTAYHYLGLVHARKKNYEEAYKYYHIAFNRRKEIGNELRLMFSYYGLADVCYKLGKKEEGKEYIDKMLDFLEKNPSALDNQQKSDILAHCYELLEDWGNAFKYLSEREPILVSREVLENTIHVIFSSEQQKQREIKEHADELQNLNNDMFQYSKQLEVSNKDLKTYAQTTSHDLREPLRMISTYMTILEAKLSSKLTEEERTFMRFAVDGSKRMDEMITRILNSAKGNKGVVFKPVDLNKVAETVKTNLTRLATEKNAVITYQGLPMIMADDIQMLQVFQNLVTNAIKYNNSPAPQVDITCAKKGDAYELSIADNGVGIPEEERQNVFEMFKRVENPSGADGTGIGLSTVKGIVEKMKGKIWIEGNQPHGTIFKIQLPPGA